jgi:hypothetical protein
VAKGGTNGDVVLRGTDAPVWLWDLAHNSQRTSTIVGPPCTVEKPLYAPSEYPSRTQKPRHCSVLALMSKCLDTVLDY